MWRSPVGLDLRRLALCGFVLTAVAVGCAEGSDSAAVETPANADRPSVNATASSATTDRCLVRLHGKGGGGAETVVEDGISMTGGPSAAREQYVGAGLARLYVRDVGDGVPIVVVHGGPDFDHEYLLPDMDRLAESFHLVYYDQRGRGRSFAGHGPDDVSLTTEIEDLDRIRDHFGFDRVAVLGHSWGGLLASEYAVARSCLASHPQEHRAGVAHGS